MSKLKFVAVVCLLIISSFVFFACDNNGGAANFSFKEENLILCEGDRVDLSDIVETENIKNISFRLENENCAYIIGNKTLACFKEGGVKLYACSGESEKSLTIQITSNKALFPTPTGLVVDRENSKLSWISIPGVFTYNVAVTTNGQRTEYVVSESEFDFAKNNIDITPNKNYIFSVRAVAVDGSSYANSNWSKNLSYNELDAVENLRYDYENNKILFNYDASLAGSTDVIFDAFISNGNSKQYRLNKNSSGNYALDFLPTLSGKYEISVVAKANGRDESKASKINVVVLEKPTLSVNANKVVACTEIDDAKISLFYVKDLAEILIDAETKTIETDILSFESGERVEFSSKVSANKKSEIVDGVLTYFVDSFEKTLVVEKLTAPKELSVVRNEKTNSTYLCWLDEGKDYKIYLDGNLVECETELFNLNGKTYYKALAKETENVGLFNYTIVSTLVGDEYKQFLDSNTSIFKPVSRLDIPQIEFDINTFEISYVVSSSDIGSTLNIEVYSGDGVVSKEEIEINSAHGSFNVSADIFEGTQIFDVKLYLSKETENEVYINSDVVEAEIHSFETLDVDASLNKETETLNLTFSKPREYSKYVIKCNGIELSREVCDLPYIYSVQSVEDSEMSTVKVAIKNYKLSGNYVFEIQAIGISNESDGLFLLDSNVFEIQAIKLDSPLVDKVKDGDKITFGWESVDFATGYKVVVINNENNNKNERIIEGCEFVFAPTSQGHFTVKICAISENAKVFNSDFKSFEIYKLEEAINISHEIINDESYIAFNEISSADSYSLSVVYSDNNELIETLTSFVVSEGIVKFDLGLTNEVFENAGRYLIKVVAISSEGNVLNSKASQFEISKLESISSVNVSYEVSGTFLNLLSLQSATAYLVSIDGGEYSPYNSNKIDVSDLQVRSYSVSVICVGNGNNILNSNAVAKTFVITKTLATPVLNDIIVDELNDNIVKLNITKIDGATRYYVEIKDDELNVIDSFLYNPSDFNVESYNIEILRANLPTGRSFIFIKAMSDDESYSDSDYLSISFDKSANLTSVSLSNGYVLDLAGKQALISGNLVTGSAELPLDSDQLQIKVRNINSFYVDAFDAANIFNLAGDWKDVSFSKIKTPEISISNGLLTFDDANYDDVEQYYLVLDITFYGMAGKYDISPDNKLVVIENYNGQVNLQEVFENNFNCDYLFGDYKISAFIVLPNQEGLNLLLVSNGATELNYRYTKQLNNSDLLYTISNSGEVIINQNKNSLIEIDEIEVKISQNLKEYNFKINCSDASVSVLKDDFSFGTLTVSKTEKINYITFKFDLINLASGQFTLCYRACGDETYFKTSENFSNTLAVYRKLLSPTLEYASSLSGNVIKIANANLYSLTNIIFEAIYGVEKKEFEFVDNEYQFIIPFEWTNVSNIKVRAISTTIGIINSNDTDVSFTKLANPTNLYFEENNGTYLHWEDSANVADYIVYYSQNNFETFKSLTTDSKNVLVSNLLVNPGKIKFRVVCKGSGEYLNSDYAEIEATKLDDNITFSSPNGVFAWNESTNLESMTGYRIEYSYELAQSNITSGTIDLNKNITTYNFENMFGYIEINFTIVGDASKNIISSKKNHFFVYKFAAPNSLKVENGKISVIENYGTNKNYVKDFEIYFETDNSEGSFSYNNYCSYSDSTIEEFYKILKDNSGELKARTLAISDYKFKLANYDCWALNSDITTSPVQFEIYDADLSNDDVYLTEEREGYGMFSTYFNYKWTETVFGQDSVLRVILKPKFEIVSAFDISGYEKIEVEDILSCYYTDVAINGDAQSGKFVSIKLPNEILAGEYEIEVQKISVGTGKLNSADIKVINFKKMESPTVAVEDGILKWETSDVTSKFTIMFDKDGNTIWKYDITDKNYEPSGFEFADAEQNVKYNCYISSMGNVSDIDLSDASNKRMLAVNYYVTSIYARKEITKLRKAGNITLGAGSLKFNEEYKYHTEENKQSLIELVLVDINSFNDLLNIEIPALEFVESVSNVGVSSFNNLLSKYLSAEQIEVLNGLSEFIIKYRQLGKTFDDVINSDYSFLSVSKGQIVNIGGTDYNKFAILKAASNNLKINDTTGVSFPASSYETSYMSEVVYQIVFARKDVEGNIIEYKYKETTSNSFSFTELKTWLENNFPTSDAYEMDMYVVAKGDNSYYLTSLASPTRNLKSLNGEASLVVDNGLLKWHEIAGAGSYEIKVNHNNETIYVLEIEKVSDSSFTIDGVTTNCIELNDGYFTFDISKYNGVNFGENSLYLRFIPTNDDIDVYAIPSGWTTTALRVYKIDCPTVSLSNGAITWNSVENAKSYTLSIKYNETSISYEKLTETSRNITISDLANALGMSVEDVVLNISNIKFEIQAVGEGLKNGVYYLTSMVNELTGVTIKVNTINDLTISGDKLSWKDSSNTNAYIIIVEEDSETNAIRKEIETSQTSYDLSTLKLPAGGKEYKVMIKVKGDDHSLSSLETNPIEFRVKESLAVSDINVIGGYITFTPNSSKAYKVKITLPTSYYYYIIEYKDGKYSNTSAYNVSNNGTPGPAIANETDIKFENGKIVFWPNSVKIASSAYVSVSACGEIIDGKTYISSPYSTYSTPIEKISRDLVSVPSFSTTVITIKTTLANQQDYIVCVVIKNGEGEKVFEGEENFNSSVKTLTFSFEALQKGTYSIELQILPKSDIQNKLKSDIKVVTKTN